MELPFLKLPILVQEDVIRIMDPAEQFSLSKSSKKLQSLVRRLTKNHRFLIIKTDNEPILTFGWTNKKSIFRWHQGSDGILHFGMDYIQMSHQNEKEGFRRICLALTEEFNPQTVFFSNPRYSDKGSIHGSFEFIYSTHTSEMYHDLTMSKDPGSYLELFREIRKPKLMESSLEIKDAHGMIIEDTRRFYRFRDIKMSNVRISQDSLNRFLKSRKRKGIIQLEIMDLKRIQGILNLEVILNGLNAKQIQNKKPEFDFCYQFENKDEDSAHLYFKKEEDNFRIYCDL